MKKAELIAEIAELRRRIEALERTVALMRGVILLGPKKGG